ncbi:short chain dehydrogenase/reductase family [Aspergillus sclerotioniger CBS 115572]|uniref:Short chain dehydrogenase/reductase family n=1 Tax=Aspergillus sclerotioniger CBS 115572 TaxID=1450535 RepID=A0A317WVP4_9EURO|nr:short chain dehydrogenase/reductase family [Aspergillus sclerotioniger CBS 115572]PWY90436.1 short chain dehydrogenase/reductase family [Aspergillus sclerotioniger CBS 115572]
MPYDISDLFNVRGLVAVITGGSSGLGKTMAIALATNGASRVYILGRRKETLEDTADMHPGIIIPIVADVGSKASLAAAAEEILADTGYINLLVANAGMVYLTAPETIDDGPGSVKVGRSLKENPTPADLESFLMETPDEEFLDTFRVNTAGVFYTIAAFVSLLDKGNQQGNVSQKSQVIAVSSVAAHNRRVTGGCAYGMSKAAVVHLMKQMMTFLIPQGIRANTISPGLFPSNLVGGPSNHEISVEGAFDREFIPLRRAGRCDEIAGAILYLASKAGGYVNGDLHLIDGGMAGCPN